VPVAATANLSATCIFAVSTGAPLVKNRAITLAALAAVLSLGLTACEKKGPVEQAGEEVDEAVNTLKNGGKETTGDKLDDAGDKAADAAREAKNAVTN
jgi:predicted small lipoprotein YifL